MKIFKVILGLLLIYSIGKEYINASKQLLSFFELGSILAVLLLLPLSAWLIGSGISKEKFNLNSWQFFKYLGGTFIIFLVVAFISLISFKYEPEIVRVNGLDVDIAEFMIGTKRIIPDKEQRRDYCICIVTKLTADKKLVDENKADFESGKFSKLIMTLKSSPDALKYNLQECMSSVSNIHWTPEFENGMRTNLIKKLSDLNSSSKNDVHKYCDCLIEEYKKVSIQELTNSDFQFSEKGLKIDSICNSISKLN